jgi:uncharacterized protein YecE (DUF72 family)
MLRHYAARFAAVELNNTFYRLPEATAVAAWRDQTHAQFRFAAKASRYLTHMKKLLDPGLGLQRFFEGIAPLEGKLGPILFQLPGGFGGDVPRLQAFLAALPSGHDYAFELRDPSWLVAAVRRTLEQHGIALCLYDFEKRRSPAWVTSERLVYVRLHGPEGSYRGSYDGRTLFGWVQRILRWVDAGLDVWFFFDNDDLGHAPNDALRLHRMLLDHGAGAAVVAPQPPAPPIFSPREEAPEKAGGHTSHRGAACLGCGSARRFGEWPPSRWLSMVVVSPSVAAPR